MRAPDLSPLPASSVPTVAGAPPPASAAPATSAVDAVVIGSGMGGLTAAALLASRGISVLVLERQHTLGGCVSAFRHDGYEFEVGLHYVSDWGADGAFPRLLRAMGAEELPARPLDPDGFDTLRFPDFTFRVPSDMALYHERLVARFPSEVEGIERYVRALREIRGLLRLASGGRGRLRRLWRGRHVLPHASQTLGAFLDTCTGDPQLRAVLAAQNGIYGEPPSRASLTEHLMAVSSYIELGAYYPAGGGAVLAGRVIHAITRQGGRLLAGAPVTRILVDRGRVRGVAYRLDGETEEREVRAPVVISDADLKHTLLELVPTTSLRPRTARRVRAYQMGSAFGAAYLGVRRDLGAEGVPVTNFWIYPSYDLEHSYSEARAGRFDPDPPCFVSLTSLKDPENARLAPAGLANMELIAVAPATPEAWGVTAESVRQGTHDHEPRYRATRDAFAERLIRSAERVLPGLLEDVVHLEVSTPLTHWKYTGATGGTPYGIAPIPSQVLWHRPRARTDVDGLYLCGASTSFGGGILPVMWSGVFAAASVVGQEVIAEAGGVGPSAVR